MYYVLYIIYYMLYYKCIYIYILNIIYNIDIYILYVLCIMYYILYIIYTQRVPYVGSHLRSSCLHICMCALAQAQATQRALPDLDLTSTNYYVQHTFTTCSVSHYVPCGILASSYYGRLGIACPVAQYLGATGAIWTDSQTDWRE